MTEILNGSVRIDTSQANQSLNQLGQTAQSAGGQVRTSMTQAAGGVQTFGTSAQGAITSLRAFKQQTDQIKESMNGAISVVGNAVSAMGQIANAMQRPAENAQQLASQMVSLAGTGAALGAAFGPGGALVGGIAGALIPAFISATSTIGDTTVALESQSREVQSLITDYNTLLRRITEAQSETARSSRVQMGLGTEGEYEAGVQSAENALRQVEAALQDNRSLLAAERNQRVASIDAERQAYLQNAISLLEDRRRTLAQEAEQARQLRQSASEQRQQDEADDWEDNLTELRVQQQEREELERRGAASRGAGAAEARERELQADIEAAQRRAEVAQALAISQAAEQLEREKEVARQSIAIAAERQRELERILEQGKAAQERADSAALQRSMRLMEDANSVDEELASLQDNFNSQTRAGVDTLLESFERYNRAAQGAGRQTMGYERVVLKSFQNIGNQIGDVLVKNFQAGFTAIATGAMTSEEAFAQMAQGILQSITELAVGEAVKNFAYALANLAEGIATQNPAKLAAAGTFAAAGALWTVVAGGAGAGLAATSSGGGGGAASTGGAQAAGAGSAQNNASDTQGGPTEPSTVVINYSGTVFSTKQEMQRELRRISRA